MSKNCHCFLVFCHFLFYFGSHILCLTFYFLPLSVSAPHLCSCVIQPVFSSESSLVGCLYVSPCVQLVSFWFVQSVFQPHFASGVEPSSRDRTVSACVVNESAVRLCHQFLHRHYKVRPGLLNTRTDLFKSMFRLFCVCQTDLCLCLYTGLKHALMYV